MTAPSVRPFEAGDALALTEILNAIIAAGGTTAYMTPFTPSALRAAHLDGPSVLCCHTVLLGTVPVGFQVLNVNPQLPEGWGDIASFTRRDPPMRGAGTALFAATRSQAHRLGLTALNATIRADNTPGLGYYARMGFIERARIVGAPLADGTPVDRIQKTFVL
ncbi:MAG: GNAT family N-acetyltransferase [Rhodobacteraceae bacterium]|nr:GNAT family N-acetyltransferase [Paracoccaceae bacterium]